MCEAFGKKLEIKIDAIKAIQKVLSNRELHAKGFVLQGIPLKIGAPLFLKTLFHEGAINMKKNQSCVKLLEKQLKF